MNQRWSLDELYTSFESEEFIRDLEKNEKLIEGLKLWAKEKLTNNNNSAAVIEEYITLQNEFYNVATRLLNFSNLTLSVEAKNETALSITEQIEQKLTDLTEVDVDFQKWLGNIDNLEAIINSSSLIKEHEFYIKEILANNKYLLSKKEEIIISKMKTTGSSAWSKLQDMISSTLLVDININGEEKQLPLPIVRNMAHEGEATLRKNAYEAEIKSYSKIEQASAACLNGIKGEVINLSKMRGFNSPLEQTLMNSRMDRETLDAMLTAMVESLPHFHKYFLKKAEKLGYKKAMPFYDMFAPIGEKEMKFTFEEAKKFILNNFYTFSNKLGDFAENAFDKRWIDAEPREGKSGGGFCASLKSIKESRILCNFTGSFSDVVTVAHELGHGYHGSCLNTETFLNSNYSMPIAETASIFCETIVKKAALKPASNEEKVTILESEISDSAQVIVDIYSRYLFETELFKRREKSSLSVNELKEMMIESQKQAYGPSLDENCLHPYMWVNKPHYYSAETNFYNFPYAFGLLFSKGLYAEYIKRGASFVDEYDKLLSVTGKNQIADVTMMMGIDIHSVDFWRSSLKMIQQDIEKFIEIV